MTNRIIGIVLPIPSEQVQRIFNKNGNVLVKYLSHIPKRFEQFRLKKEMKVLLYVSNSGRKIAGEAKIKNIEFLSPNDAITRYGRNLLVSELEMSRYVHSQPRRNYDKPLLVLELINIKEYPEGLTYHKNVSMVGEYLTKETYERIHSIKK